MTECLINFIYALNYTQQVSRYWLPSWTLFIPKPITTNCTAIQISTSVHSVPEVNCKLDLILVRKAMKIEWKNTLEMDLETMVIENFNPCFTFSNHLPALINWISLIKLFYDNPGRFKLLTRQFKDIISPFIEKKTKKKLMTFLSNKSPAPSSRRHRLQNQNCFPSAKNWSISFLDGLTHSIVWSVGMKSLNSWIMTKEFNRMKIRAEIRRLVLISLSGTKGNVCYLIQG